MAAPDFPDCMPQIWDAHWGSLPAKIGVPVLIGEWGGLWGDDLAATASSTAAWQRKLQAYLAAKNMSYFYWALNDNSFKTGGLFNARNYRKWAMLSTSPATHI
eukprot:4866799-Prymnesium_polylepis.1